jgi:cytochrome c55X
MSDPRPLACIAAIVVSAGPTLAETLPPERRAELERLVLHDCGSCHGMSLKGGLGSDLTPETLTGRDAHEIARIVLDGVPGTAMPPWRPLLTEAEAAWIAEYLIPGASE